MGNHEWGWPRWWWLGLVELALKRTISYLTLSVGHWSTEGIAALRLPLLLVLILVIINIELCIVITSSIICIVIISQQSLLFLLKNTTEKIAFLFFASRSYSIIVMSLGVIFTNI